MRNYETGFARFLHGGSRSFGVEPISDQDFADLALVAISSSVPGVPVLFNAWMNAYDDHNAVTDSDGNQLH